MSNKTIYEILDFDKFVMTHVKHNPPGFHGIEMTHRLRLVHKLKIKTTKKIIQAMLDVVPKKDREYAVNGLFTDDVISYMKGRNDCMDQIEAAIKLKGGERDVSRNK